MAHPMTNTSRVRGDLTELDQARIELAPLLTDVPVAAVMTHDVVCVGPDVSIVALTSLLVDRGISGVPVVDDNACPIGMISKTDLLRLPAAAPESATVADYMTPITFTLREDAPLAQAAALMAWEGVHRIPVCSAEGDVVGILSTLDVVRWLATAAGYPARR